MYERLFLRAINNIITAKGLFPAAPLGLFKPDFACDNLYFSWLTFFFASLAFCDNLYYVATSESNLGAHENQGAL